MSFVYLLRPRHDLGIVDAFQRQDIFVMLQYVEFGTHGVASSKGIRIVDDISREALA